MRIFLLLDPNAQQIKDIYGLRGQVEHKIAFLRAHVPKETKLVVIGHSIGSYIALQILKHAPELPVSVPRRRLEAPVVRLHRSPPLSFVLCLLFNDKWNR